MIRKASIQDLKDIMEIIEQTIIIMKSDNNFQWDSNYPKENDFLNDIKNNNLYVLIENNIVVGFICINNVDTPEYNSLNWSVDNVMFIHRVVIHPKYRRCGFGTKLLKFADKLALKNNMAGLKTDTYSSNKKMDLLFRKCGYNFIGQVYFNGKEKPFFCYEKKIK